MTITLVLLIAVTIVSGLAWARLRFLSFRAQKPEDYPMDAGPQFDIRERLNGPVKCEGVIFGPLGRVSSRFDADFNVRWEGNIGVMTEHFRYDSGREQHREWRLSVGNDGRIKAEADDVIGTGTGRQHGSAMSLTYRIKLTDEAGGHVLDTTDWMYLTPEGVIINRSQFRKFGIKVAELVATLRPGDAEQIAAE